MPGVHDETEKSQIHPLQIPQTQQPSDLHVFNWPLSNRVSVEVHFRGGKINSKHIEALRQYLELAKNALETDDEDGFDEDFEEVKE